MTFYTKLAGIVSGVVSDKVYLQALPEQVELPCIVMRTIEKEPLSTLCATSDIETETVYHMAFECRADTFETADAVATELGTALNADTTLVKWVDPSPGEDFEPDYEEFMQPVYFGFHYRGVP